MPALFQPDKSQLSASLELDGYAIIDLAGPEELEALRAAYREFKPQIDSTTSNGIHMTTWIRDRETKFRIRDRLEAILSGPFNQIFQDYKLLNTVFIVKNRHKVSNFPLHQDWSFVNEEVYVSVNVWIALQDTDPGNGGLYVIPGSHRLNNPIRGAGKLSFDFSAYKDDLREYLIPVRLKAGQAVLFYYSTIHGSPANTTDQARVVVATTVTPRKAELLVNYYDESEQALLQYHVPDDFTYLYDDIRSESQHRAPAGELVRKIAGYEPLTITPEDIRAVSIRKPRSFIETIRSLINR